MVGLSPDTLALVCAARQAGLTVSLRGERVVIRGPRRAADLAWRLAGRKPELRVWLSPRRKYALLGNGHVLPLTEASEGLPAGTVCVSVAGDAEWSRLTVPVPEAVKMTRKTKKPRGPDQTGLFGAWGL